MELGWQYHSIVKKCLSPLEMRPASTMELLSMVEFAARRRTIGLKVISFFLVFIIIGICWYYYHVSQIQSYDNDMEQTVTTDTSDAEILLESNPPSETLTYTDYTRVLSEVKKIIDEDVKPIDAMMDTITRMNNVPSSYFTFLENEAEKLNELAQRHRGEINPSNFNEFYSEMMSYYKSKTDKWKGILERLE